MFIFKKTLSTISSLNLTKLLALAILIRLLIMPFYYHPDIKTTNFKVSFLSSGVTDIYSYIANNKSKLPIPEDFNYYPLTYYALGFYQMIASPFLGNDFHDWLNDASQTAQEREGVFRYLFILKLPYLFVDIATAFLLMAIFLKPEDKRKAFIYWLFNPFSIILIYVFSNLDIIPAAFTVASLVMVRRKKLVLSALLIGLGAAFKMYPLLFLPFLFLEGKNLKEKFLISLTAITPLVLSILPFIRSNDFRQAALVSGLTTRIVTPDFSIGFGESIIIPVILISGLFFYRLSQENNQLENLWKYYLGLILMILSFIHFHVQWILWLLPLVIIYLVKYSKTSLAYLLIFLAMLIPFFYEDKFMSVSLLTAVSHYYELLPTPFNIAQKSYDPYIVQSVLHGLFAGGSLVFVLQLFNKKET
jgi:hypothetical protein